MDNTAIQLELKRINDTQQNQLSDILDALQNSDYAEARKKLNYTPASVTKTLTNELEDIYRNYRLPYDTLENFHCYIRQYRFEQHSIALERERVRNRIQYAHNTTNSQRIINISPDGNNLPQGAAFVASNNAGPPAIHPDYARETPPFDMGTYIVKKHRAVYGINPVTNKKYDRPLEYTHAIVLEDFEQCIHKLPLTNTINLHTTMKQILETCQEYGLTKQMIRKLLVLMVNKYYQQHSYLIESESDHDKVFKIVVGLIQVGDYLAAINKAIDEFKRKPEDTLSTVIQSYICLQTHRLQFTYPNMSTYNIENKTRNMAKFIITHLISDQAKKAFHTWLALRKEAGEDPQLDEFIKYISELEGKDQSYALKYPKTIPTTNQTNILMYNRQVEDRNNRNRRNDYRNNSRDRGRRDSYRSPGRNTSRNYGGRSRSSTPNRGRYRGPNGYRSRSSSYNGRGRQMRSRSSSWNRGNQGSNRRSGYGRQRSNSYGRRNYRSRDNSRSNSGYRRNRSSSYNRSYGRYDRSRSNSRNQGYNRSGSGNRYYRNTSQSPRRNNNRNGYQSSRRNSYDGRRNQRRYPSRGRPDSRDRYRNRSSSYDKSKPRNRSWSNNRENVKNYKQDVKQRSRSSSRDKKPNSRSTTPERYEKIQVGVDKLTNQMKDLLNCRKCGGPHSSESCKIYQKEAKYKCRDCNKYYHYPENCRENKAKN